MKNVRIIGNVLIKDEIAVQSINFKEYLPIGKPKILIDFLSMWGIDEIIILDIKGSIKNNFYLKNNLKEITQNSNTPISAGGGIKSIKDVENLIRGGADKVVINSCGISNPNLIKKSALEFGNQAVIGSIDVKKVNNNYIVFTHSGKKKSKFSIFDAIKIYEENQAGEILINSIDNDGLKKGFDIKLIEIIKSQTQLPIIICGGAGNFQHYAEIMKYNLSGIAAGNFLSFTEHSVNNLKYYLKKLKKNNEIRFEKNNDRKNFDFQFRYSKKNDKLLELLKYKKIIKNEI